MIRLLLIYLCFFFFSSCLIAQNFDERIVSSDIVLEGKVIEKQSFWNDKSTLIYTISKVEVYKVFKGNITEETISVRTEGGIVGDQVQYSFHSPHLSENREGIFILNQSKERTNLMSHHLIEYSVQGEKFEALIGSDLYSNPSRIYDRITGITGESYSKIKPNSIEKSIAIWLNETMDVISSTDILIEFTFENIQLVGLDKVEFDIMAKSNQPGIRFATSDVYLDYDTGVFGLNVVQNEKIHATKETVIENNVYALQLADENSSKVRLLVDAAFQPDQFYTLSQIAEKFIHVELDIADVINISSISFDGLLMTNQSFFYDGVSQELIGFDKVSVEEPIFPFLLPNIDFFTPTTIPAGTGDILTIVGTNFGDFSPGQSTVMFVDGDSLNLYMQAGRKDFEWDGVIHWSDTLIQVKVPSVDENELIEEPAATGKIKVRNADGEIVSSMDKLLIPYSIHNIRQNAGASTRKVTLKASDDGNTGICINISSAVPGYLHHTIRSALNQWCNAVGANFSIGDIVSTNQAAIDGESVIFYGGEVDGLGGGMAINGIYFAEFCINSLPGGGAEVGHMGDEVDFVIYAPNSLPSNSQINQFKEVLIHEFGHAHMLGHATNGIGGGTQYIMHPMGNPTGTITSTDIEGANLLLTNSMNIVSESCGIPFGSGSCGVACTTSIYEQELNKRITVFPNPIDGTEVNISISEVFETEVQVRVYDARGVLVNESFMENGKKAHSLKLPDIAGFYLVQFGVYGEQITRKVLKL